MVQQLEKIENNDSQKVRKVTICQQPLALVTFVITYTIGLAVIVSKVKGEWEPKGTNPQKMKCF